jgi:hypothetical protein
MKVTFLTDFASYLGDRNIVVGDTLKIQFLMDIVPFIHLDKEPPTPIDSNLKFPSVGIEQIIPNSHIYKIIGKIKSLHIRRFTEIDCGFPLLTKNNYDFLGIPLSGKTVLGFGELIGIYSYDLLSDDSLKCLCTITYIDYESFSIRIDENNRTLPLPLITVTIDKIGH